MSKLYFRYAAMNAGKSTALLRRMSGVLNETSNPGHLITFKGMVRLFTE